MCSAPLLVWPQVKEVPKTLDSIRVKDDTMVEAEDEEVRGASFLEHCRILVS